MPLDCLRRTVGGVEEVGVLGPRVLHAVLLLQEGLSHAAPLHLPPEPREDVDYGELTLGERHPIRCIFASYDARETGARTRNGPAGMSRDEQEVQFL